MKYSFSGRSPLDIIRNYRIVDNEIIITYLPSYEERLPFTVENEVKVLEKMLLQARDRSECFSLENAKKDRDYYLPRIISHSLLALSNTINLCKTNSQYVKSLAGFALTLCSISVAFASYEYCKRNNRIKDVEKYNIYLELKDKLDELNNSLNSSIPIELEKNGIILNINTLDDFSLREIKQFRKKIIDNDDKQNNKFKVKKLAR